MSNPDSGHHHEGAANAGGWAWIWALIAAAGFAGVAFDVIEDQRLSELSLIFGFAALVGAIGIIGNSMSAQHFDAMARGIDSANAASDELGLPK